MDLAESDLLFIDVDASVPAVKQEQEEITDYGTNHSRYPSSLQLKILLERLEKNPDLARGSLRSEKISTEPGDYSRDHVGRTLPDRQRARRFWEQIRVRLNSIEGTKKSSNQWMKYWTDKKMFVKKKATQGESGLTELEEKIYYLGGGGTYRKSVRKKELNKTDLDEENSQDAPKAKSFTEPINDNNKCTNINCQNHTETQFERILRVEERRLLMEQSTSELMRTILQQTAQRELTILNAIKSLEDRMSERNERDERNERNERDAMMAGALKTLGEGLLALSESLKSNNQKDRYLVAGGRKGRGECRYKCSTCHYVTYHRSLFQEHLNRHNGIKPYKCELCPYSSVSKKYAKKHQEKHKSCACGYLSRNAVELKRHVAKCGKDPAYVAQESFPCAACNKEFVDDKGLAKHIANRQTCTHCSLECCAGSLRSHMVREHSVLPEQSNKYRFQCALCPWTSSLHQKILLHLIHHPGQQVDPGLVDVSVLRNCGILVLPK